MHSRAPRRAIAACAVIAFVLVVTGAWLLVRVTGVITSSVTMNGVPMLEVSGAGQPSGMGVVVVHGFAGSARLMRGFADTLARRGHIVVLPDLAGHGLNTTPLSEAEVDRDVGTAVSYLRQRRDIGADRIALVGHSMGAAAVTRFAVAHPEIHATVAISLPSADELPAGADRPRDLLVLVGGAEFAGFRSAATEALHRGAPGAPLGATVGDLAQGTGRRAVMVPGVEHISILYAARTHQETADWVDAALGGSGTGAPPHPTDRLAPAGLILAGLLLGIVPVAAWVLPRRPGRAGDGPGVDRRRMLSRLIIGTAVGCALAVATARFLPTTALPLAVGGYATGFFLLVGTVLLAVGGWGRRRAAHAAPRVGVLAVPVLLGYAVVAAAVPMHLGFTNAVPSGQRWWLLPVVIAGSAVLLWGAEVAGGGQTLAVAGVLAATTVAMASAAIIGAGPGFLLLVLPLLAILFAWHVGWSAWLRRRGAPTWLLAGVGALIISWPIVTALPVQG